LLLVTTDHTLHSKCLWQADKIGIFFWLLLSLGKNGHNTFTNSSLNGTHPASLLGPNIFLSSLFKRLSLKQHVSAWVCHLQVFLYCNKVSVFVCCCCSHQRYDADRTYLRYCPVRAWTRLLCFEGVREWWRLCSVTSTDFHWWSLLITNSYAHRGRRLIRHHCCR